MHYFNVISNFLNSNFKIDCLNSKWHNFTFEHTLPFEHYGNYHIKKNVINTVNLSSTDFTSTILLFPVYTW